MDIHLFAAESKAICRILFRHRKKTLLKGLIMDFVPLSYRHTVVSNAKNMNSAFFNELETFTDY